MSPQWRIQPAGYAIREVALNSMDQFAGTERLVQVREPGGNTVMIGMRDVIAGSVTGTICTCSCGAWDCTHLAILRHAEELDASRHADEPPTPPAAA